MASPASTLGNRARIGWVYGLCGRKQIVDEDGQRVIMSLSVAPCITPKQWLGTKHPRSASSSLGSTGPRSQPLATSWSVILSTASSS